MYTHVITPMLERLMSPKRTKPENLGDEKTERHDYLIIEKEEKVWRIKAGDGDPEDGSHDFNKTVDYLTINDERITPNGDFTLIEDGVAFDYYWSLDFASIDILV